MFLRRQAKKWARAAMTTLVFIIWKPSDEAPSQEAGNKPSPCGFKSASSSGRFHLIIKLVTHEKRLLRLLRLWFGKEAAVETDLLLDYELVPIFQRNTKFSTWIQFSAATWVGRSWSLRSSQMKAAVNQNICTWR